MKTSVMKFLRVAWMNATGIYLAAQQRAEQKEIRTNIIKRTLNRSSALHQFFPLHIPDIPGFLYKEKRLRIHTTPPEELWNYR
jgi:hypothetical protein